MSEDYESQQAWWDSLTPAQQEAYEDGLERRRAEREAAREPYPSRETPVLYEDVDQRLGGNDA